MAANTDEEKVLKALEELKILKDSQQKLADQIRDMKKDKANPDEIKAAVEKLKTIKEAVEKKQKEAYPEKVEFPREAFQRMLTQRFFIAPAFEIYGGIAGLYDLGPPATAIKANILSLWRQHYVLTENMLEIDSASVTPEPVLVTSGHVAKFCDLMVKDVVTGACYRADHLLEHHLDHLIAQKPSEEKIDEYKTVQAQADALSEEEMHDAIQKYGVKAPDTGNGLTKPEPFNLMFKTSIGPTGGNPGYLRPETAQGIFVNFKRLLEFNGGKLPFAAAQIGQAFRNEIAPRSGLLRVREFTLAEIEHFVHPEDKAHPKFAQLANMPVTLFPREDQTTTKKTTEMTLGEAVKKGVINNETLAYFIGRTHLFLLACGVKRDKLRFRQHLKDEMAHYACDCWDAEIQNSYGWTECVGIADRSAFDLSAHSKATQELLQAFVEYKDGARNVEVVTLKLEKKVIAKELGGAAVQPVSQYLSTLSTQEAIALEKEFSTKDSVTVVIKDQEYHIKKSFITKFEKENKRVTGEHIIPGVIEPSFGIGRILYSVLEHAYYTREGDEQRSVLSLPPAIAPVKVSVLPLLQKQVELIPSIVQMLTENGISCKVEEGGQSIGRRYARTDQIGIPFGITIDYQTAEDKTITLRERDSTTQVRVKIDEVVSLLLKLIRGGLTWEEVRKTFPHVEVKEN